MALFKAELYRCAKNKWFYIAALLTVFALFLELGEEIYWLAHGSQMEISYLFERALTGRGNALSLPLLAALPCSAAAWREISGGAARNTLFRCGMRAYLASRATTLVLCSVASQIVGMGIFSAILSVITGGAALPVNLLVARLLSAAVFALIGSIGAFLSRDATSAYIMPVVMCFALSMIRKRFMVGAIFIDPFCWLQGGKNMLVFLGFLLISLLLIDVLLLYREVKRSV